MSQGLSWDLAGKVPQIPLKGRGWVTGFSMKWPWLIPWGAKWRREGPGKLWTVLWNVLHPGAKHDFSVCETCFSCRAELSSWPVKPHGQSSRRADPQRLGQEATCSKGLELLRVLHSPAPLQGLWCPAPSTGRQDPMSLCQTKWAGPSGRFQVVKQNYAQGQRRAFLMLLNRLRNRPPIWTYPTEAQEPG